MDGQSRQNARLDGETLAACAARITEAYSRGEQIAPLTDEHPDMTVADAYAIADLVRQERERAGERVIGWKIGFTNRTIWDQYGVRAPIWGPMYDTTTRPLAQPGDDLRAGEWLLAGLTEPQVEAEIAFRFSAVPRVGADERALLDVIDAISHSFEIVRCPYPGWSFQPADTMAAAGLHGGLATGPWFAVGDADRDEWARALSDFSITVRSDDGIEDSGSGENVLGGPLSALRHFVEESARVHGHVIVRPGDIITTGTVPRAYPIRPGQHWETQVHGLPLPGLSVHAV